MGLKLCDGLGWGESMPGKPSLFELQGMLHQAKRRTPLAAFDFANYRMGKETVYQHSQRRNRYELEAGGYYLKKTTYELVLIRELERQIRQAKSERRREWKAGVENSVLGMAGAAVEFGKKAALGCAKPAGAAMVGIIGAYASISMIESGQNPVEKILDFASKLANSMGIF